MTLSTFSEIMTYLSPLVLFIGTSVGIFYHKKLDKITKLLLYFLMGSLAIDIFSRVLGELLNNNLILYVALSLLELLIFFNIYDSLCKKKKIIRILTVIGVSYTLIESIYLNANNVELFQPYAKALTPLLIVIMTIVYFFELIQDEMKLVKGKARYFSFNSIVLCFFALEFLFLVPINFLINGGFYLAVYVLLAHVFLLVLFYSYLTYFIWKHGRNPKQ
ncbi:hypothetical protein [uncultured Kordia sp.]|uniref:hypothetical protein n=1 Tax=uncultured Kordia sp. TaxID=507699 RepID=UPI002616D53B|nr:hypothetical protein [uncultured Kordia sp.]